MTVELISGYMSKMETIKGIFRTFWRMSLEDFVEMDHKLVRITVSIITFIVVAFVWFYVFRSISPFKF